MAQNAKNMTPQATEATNNYVTALSYDAGNNLEYLGRANIGTAQSATGWQIKKLSYDGSDNLTDIQQEGGNATFDAVWDDRAGLSYS